MIDISHCAGIVSHAHCADGIASAMILHSAYPEFPVKFAQYGAASLLELDIAPWLFCDISPDRERAQAFVDAGAVVLDHHAHAKDIVALFGERGVYADEPGVSGALLAYRQAKSAFFEQGVENVHRFAKVVGVRDTWQTHSPDWEDACATAEALLFYGEHMLSGGQPPFITIPQIEVGHLLVNKRRKRAAELADSAWTTEAHGLTFAVFCDPGRMSSDAAEHLRQSGSSVGALATYRFVEPGPRVVWELRSIGSDIDVGAIAKRLGGGGHVRAAGFTMADARFEQALKDTLAGRRGETF